MLFSHLVSSELCDEVIEESVVEIFTTEEGIAVGRLNLENSLLDLENTNIEGSTAKIVNCDTKNRKKQVMNPFKLHLQYKNNSADTKT